MISRIEKVVTRQHLPGLRTCLHDGKAALVGHFLRLAVSLPLLRVVTPFAGEVRFGCFRFHTNYYKTF